VIAGILELAEVIERLLRRIEPPRATG